LTLAFKLLNLSYKLSDNRLERGLLTIHFEKIVLEKACELETRVSKPLERKFGFEVETIPS
jgi:hypothetical protein